MESTRPGKVKVYDRHCQFDSRADRYRHSSCRCDEAAITAVIEQHGMSSFAMECRLTLDCTDEDPFNYVFVEGLQLLQDWLSKDQHFANVLRVSRWDKRENLTDLLMGSFGNEFVESRTGAVCRKILCDVFMYHRPCLYARVLFNDMLHSDIEAMAVCLIERGFELIASRIDDHVLEARAASGRDMLKCLFNILFRVITDYSYYVDILSTAVDSGHDAVIRNAVQAALIYHRHHRKGTEPEDICQKLFKAAVRSGNSELVRMLLQLPQLHRYVDVNCVVDATSGDTALHLACRMGSTLINQTFHNYLYREAVHIARCLKSEVDQKHAGALSLTCWSNYYRFVAAAASTDEGFGRGLDGWMLAAMSSEMQKLQLNIYFDEYVEVTQLLIQHGVELYARNKKGETALHVAASLQLHGDVLLEVYAICPTYDLEKDLRWKRDCGLLGTLKFLQEKNLEKCEIEMLFACVICELFSPGIVTLLGTVVSSYFGNVRSLISTLLQVKMDINSKTPNDETALRIAAEEASKCIAFCRQLNNCHRCFAVCDYLMNQVRERAAAVGEFLRANIFTIARELLLHSADWHVDRSNGTELLSVALQSNQTDLLVELICQGAEPASWPEYLISVFQSENQGVAKKTVETVSSIGVTVGFRNDAGQTALHIAAERDLADVVRELIHIGADTEAVDNAGRTPVRSALQNGSSNAIVAFESWLPAGLLSISNTMGRNCTSQRSERRPRRRSC